MSTGSDRLYAGIDWASKTHAICVVDDRGRHQGALRDPQHRKTFTGLVKRLTKLGVDGVAIERCDGPLVEALLDGDLQVFVITPRQVKGLRSRYTGSGAKSDAGDAYLLADVLRTDGHRLTPLTQDSEATQVLRSLSRTRKQLVEARVGLVNQLRAELERCFPGAIGLFARLDSDVTIAFLRRYPTQHAAARLTRPGSPPSCGASPTAAARVSPSSTPVSAKPRPRVCPPRKPMDSPLRGRTAQSGRDRPNQERELEAEIIERLDAHADAPTFTSLPRAGHGVRAAALLAEIGDVRERFPDEESLAALAGVAPVTKASGKHHAVGFRWAADKKLRNALIDFADDSRHASPWAANIYNDAIARGKRHPHAVRILARAWVRVIWRCWQDHTPYNPQLHGGAMRIAA